MKTQKTQIVQLRLRFNKMLINCLCGILRWAHGTQEPSHIQKHGEVTNTAQRNDSPAQIINQRFLNTKNSASTISETASISPVFLKNTGEMLAVSIVLQVI
jgi:hypothetical protein